MRRTRILAASVALFCATTVWAQGQQSAGQQGGLSNDPFDQTRQQQFPERQFQRPLILSGKVMLDDGTPPPGPVKIYMDCDGRKRPAGYTTTKGHFSVDLNDRNNMAFADASVGGNPNTFGQNQGAFGAMSGNISTQADGMGRVNLFGCQLSAELGGYRAEPIQLGARSVFDNPDVGTMILHRMDGVEGTSVSFTTLSAPKKAKKSFDKAFKEVQKKKPNFEKAEKELEKAVAEHPKFAMAWNLMGRLRMQRDDKEGAQDAFEKAVEADAKYLEPYGELARIALLEERWDDAVQFSNQLLRLNPYAMGAYYFSAVANFRLDRMDASEKAVMDLKEKGADKQFPQSRQILGMIQAKQGRYEEAATTFRSYLTLDPNGQAVPHIERQLHEWEVLGVIKKQEAAAQVVPVATP